MSAESPRRVAQKGSTSHIVLPKPVNDLSLIDSVAGFIQDVVPQVQAYTGSGVDSREVITWAKVLQSDINDPAQYPDVGEQDGVPPLLLALGYGSGVQVWSVPASGEAREVLSWSQGVVRTLCVLPNPESRLPLQQDLFRHKRPIVAMVDNAGPGPQFCSVSFISLRSGDQVKSIKFSNQVWDVVANRRSVVVTLAERIAVFDSATLEDNLVVTTCYPSPDVNPVALGTRWLAYADRRLVSQWRSLGGCLAEGPQSVTATVFYAAKYLGKGLRDLSGSVASTLTGSSPEITHNNTPTEPCMKGVVTLLDIESKVPKDANEEEYQVASNQIIAHFNAHSEPIVALSFDPSGMLLVSADKRGHRFHVFRINPHPCGPTLAYAQHLYVLHRGDTSARIQDITFSADSRWLAISSMRGTTHVFPITTYGGPVGVRTHTTPQVVNKLSRFHQSAGLMDEGRGSPILWEGPGTPPPCQPAPASAPTVVPALAQIRRFGGLVSPTEDSVIRVAACFGAPRASLSCGPVPSPTLGNRTRRIMDSLYIMACNGSLIQYDLEPRHKSGISKEKVCDDTGVELIVDAKAEWLLQRPPYCSSVHPPLTCTNPLLKPPEPPTPTPDDDEHWLSQVEIVTHAGPHRRLWMGPQFTFMTVNGNNDVGETLDINKQVVRSNPVNMPLKKPMIIESGSCSSLELSPNMVELVYKTDCSWSCRLREDLAEAMLEYPVTRNTGVMGTVMREPVIEHQVNPIGSVVRLTSQLNFPAELRSNHGKVVGTETNKITLESRYNKSIAHPTVSKCILNESGLAKAIGPRLISVPVQITDLGDSNFNTSRSNSKFNQKSISDIDAKIEKKVLAVVDDNVLCVRKKAEEKYDAAEGTERKGKIGKNKRRANKGDKNKIKQEIELKSSDEFPTSTNITSVELSLNTVEKDEYFPGGSLQGDWNVEMNLSEPSAERDLDDIVSELEEYKGHKRSLENSAKIKSSDFSDDHSSDHLNKSNVEGLNEKHKSNSRQRKKCRKNNPDSRSSKNLDDDLENGQNLEIKNIIDSESIFSDVLAVVDEKEKSKRENSNKSLKMGDSVCGGLQINNENNVEMEKVDYLSIETITPESCQGSLELESISNETDSYEGCYEKITFKKEDMAEEQPLGIIGKPDEVELNCFEQLEQHIIDGQIGFKSHLQAKDSDEEINQIKNQDITYKDSIENSEIKVRKKSKKPQKKMQKIREIETNQDKKSIKGSSSKHDISSKEPKTQKVIYNKFGPNFTHHKAFAFHSNNESLGICQENELDINDCSFPKLVNPKQHRVSRVSSNIEDTNGNISKQVEPVAQVRSWSSVAAGPSSKSQDTAIVKINSLENINSEHDSSSESDEWYVSSEKNSLEL